MSRMSKCKHERTHTAPPTLKMLSAIRASCCQCGIQHQFYAHLFCKQKCIISVCMWQSHLFFWFTTQYTLVEWCGFIIPFTLIHIVYSQPFVQPSTICRLQFCVKKAQAAGTVNSGGFQPLEYTQGSCSTDVRTMLACLPTTQNCLQAELPYLLVVALVCRPDVR